MKYSLTLLIVNIYFSYGLYELIAFIKNGQSIALYCYIWIVSIILILCITLFQFVLNKRKQTKKFRDESKRNKKAIKRYKQTLLKENSDSERKEFLKQQFESALCDIKQIDHFIKISKSIITKHHQKKQLSYDCANYTTKLLLKYLNINIEESNKIFYNYIDNLLPKVGFNTKSSDVASLGLVLGIISKNDEICKKVFSNILGDQFNINETDNELLLFNLSCYYALKKDKASLLLSTDRALKYGKKPNDFLNDPDFEAYYNDDDFLEIIKNHN